MGMQPILPITVSVKKIKSAARQRYDDGDEVVRCEQTFTVYYAEHFTLQRMWEL